MSTSKPLDIPRPADASSATPRERCGSEAPSSTSSSLTELTSISASNTGLLGSSTAQSKKRKLTFAEREVEKAVKRREKEEKAKAKDEEKRVKDEEKRRKAEEREASKRLKEVEKAEKDAVRKVKDAERAEKKKAKDAEKEEKEAEKAKKERAQMRLGAFFNRPAPASTPPLTPEDGPSNLNSRRSSIASIEMGEADVEPRSTETISAAYTSWILPFFPHEHTNIAPVNRFLVQKQASNDVLLDLLSSNAPEDIQGIREHFAKAPRPKKEIVSVKTLISDLSGSINTPIDLDNVGDTVQDTSALNRIPYKILSFKEDVRPPYQGTYTRPVPARSSRKLSRKPTYRGLPDTNYDYDSEAEWQEPEPDDEELGEEDEMSEDEDEADEIADFLDDEDDIGKRKVLAADVEPVSTGICWEGEGDTVVGGIDLWKFRLDVLHDSTNLPIDPYSTRHWAQPNSTPTKSEKSLVVPTAASSMQPPRFPLSMVNAPNVSPFRAFVTGSKSEDVQAQKENHTLQPSKQRGRAANPDKSVKMIPADMLPAFKAAIEGSDLNKVALTEILKKKFPKLSKDAIKDTLSTVAIRQGQKEADKRWVLVA